MFLTSLCVCTCTFFIPSSLGLVLFTVAMGYLLSQDLTQIPELLCGRKGDTLMSSPARALTLGWWSLPLSTLLLSAALTEAALLHNLSSSAGLNRNISTVEFWGSRDVVSDPQAVIGWILISLFIITRVLREVQGACVFGGLILNPFFPKRVSSVQAFRRKTKGLWGAAIVHRILLNLGEEISLLQRCVAKSI